MDNFINTCWWLVALYLLPTLICVGFCFYKGENPFRRDFESRHYVFNVTEDNFVFDDVANPELKMQKYPSGEFVVYRIQLNGHNIKIKNMTIPKNVQLEICDKYEELFETTTSEKSPVVGFAKDGVLNQQGAAGI